jgi:hypothetical protein
VQMFRPRGISAAGHETTPEFRGTLDSRDDSGEPKKS